MILPDTEAMIWSAARADTVRPPLLIMMHGHGGVEQDMAEHFDALPPELQAVSLRAPVPLRDRWTWCDYPRQGPAAFDAAARGVLAWIDTLPEPASIGLAGFSQGGAMAIQLMRLEPRRFAYALHLSAFVMPGPAAGDAELLRVRPPVLTGHGALDDVIGIDEPFRGLDWMRRHSTLTERTYPGLGHGISDEVLADSTRFLRHQLDRLDQLNQLDR